MRTERRTGFGCTLAYHADVSFQLATDGDADLDLFAVQHGYYIATEGYDRRHQELLDVTNLSGEVYVAVACWHGPSNRWNLDVNSE